MRGSAGLPAYLHTYCGGDEEICRPFRLSTHLLYPLLVCVVLFVIYRRALSLCIAS